LHATDKLGPVSFPSSYGEYPDVLIAVFLNYAPDDELDKKGNPTLHFQEEKEEHARQRKKEQEEQAPKARCKYKTFDDQLEDLKRFKETHGHANVTSCEDTHRLGVAGIVDYRGVDDGDDLLMLRALPHRR
jgi:hypothetical protein